MSKLSPMYQLRRRRFCSAWIQSAPPSGNELRRKFRHWAAYGRLREAWKSYIFVCMSSRASVALRERTEKLSADRTRKPELTDIEITVVRPRRLDDDNLQAGLKPLLDGLKHLGYIVNDSPRWIRLTVNQEIGERPETQIVISYEESKVEVKGAPCLTTSTA